MNRIFYKNMNMNYSTKTCHELLCIFGDFIALGKQDAEVTKSLEMMTVVQVQHEGIL